VFRKLRFALREVAVTASGTMSSIIEDGDCRFLTSLKLTPPWPVLGELGRASAPSSTGRCRQWALCRSAHCCCEHAAGDCHDSPEPADYWIGISARGGPARGTATARWGRLACPLERESIKRKLREEEA
jgi:hypothetical protein